MSAPADVYTCSRRGWTRLTYLRRIHPEDMREVMQRQNREYDLGLGPDEIERYVAGEEFRLGGCPHGDPAWQADPSVPRGQWQDTMVFE